MKTNQSIKKLTAISTFFFALLISTSAIAQKTVNASNIMKDIKSGKDVVYENVTIVGDLDMTFMDEKLPDLPKKRRWWKNGGSNTVEQQVEGKVSFKNCTFEDNVYAYIHDEDTEYTFIANFEHDVIFSNCTFKEDALFKYSDFERGADFSNSKFHQKTTFKYAEFENNADFSSTVFEKDGIFKYSQFKEGVSFNNATFEDDLDIKYTKVRGDFDIKNLTVSDDIDSKYTSINGKSFSKHLLNRKN